MKRLLLLLAASFFVVAAAHAGEGMWTINARLVGLIFDGNPPSLGGAFWYDGKLNRAVAVDSAVILAGLKKVYHANRLVTELNAD